MITRTVSLPINKTKGFALLEVLIAIVVIAFGLLGLAGLQGTSMKANHSAYFRSIATQQAYDMTDRMRANKTGVSAGNYDNISGIGSNPGCISTGCTAAQITQYDKFRWNTDNASLLPSGQGIVCKDSTPDGGTPASPGCDGSGDIFVIKIWWDDEKKPGNPLKLFVTSFQP